MRKHTSNDGPPIRVLHLINGLATGGAERMLHKLVTRSDRERFRHVVVSMMDEGTLGAQIEAAGVPVFALGMRRGRPSAAASWRLVRLLRRERPEVLQTWIYHADFLGLISGKLTRVPRIVWNLRCSATPVTLRNPMTHALVRALAKLSRLPDAVIANARAGVATHERFGYAPRRWELISNGFDLDELRPRDDARKQTRVEHGIPEETCVVGMVANFEPPKDHRTFFRAANILARELTTVEFILVGRGVTESNLEIAREIAGTCLAGRVHLLGERTDVPAILPAFDLAVSSSCEEGFANTIGESMACGVPCLVTEAGDSARIVGNTGRVVPPRDPEKLANAMRALVTMDPSARHRLGEAARARISDQFNLAGVVSQYEELYRALAGRS